MSVNVNIHPSRSALVIQASVLSSEGAPLDIVVADSDAGQLYRITLYTGSAMLSAALSEAINSAMERFLKRGA